MMSKLEKVIALLEAAQDYAKDEWHNAMYAGRDTEMDIMGFVLYDIAEALKRCNSVI